MTDNTDGLVLTTYKIPPPDDVLYGSAIASIQNPHTTLSIVEPSIQRQLDINGALWKVCGEWLIKKKWISRQKISANRSVTKATEPLGELLYRILEVCIQCHTFLPADTPYRNAADWFEAVVSEMQKLDFEEITSKSERKERGKTQYLKPIRADLKLLKYGKNPNDYHKDPATHAMVDAGLAMFNKSDLFAVKYWKPLIRAYSSWATEIDRNTDWEYLHVNEKGLLVGHSNRVRGQNTLGKSYPKPRAKKELISEKLAQ